MGSNHEGRCLVPLEDEDYVYLHCQLTVDHRLPHKSNSETLDGQVFLVAWPVKTTVGMSVPAASKP